MTIKQIFDEIGRESSTNKKTEILTSHKYNDLLKEVLYLANSKRVKYFIKQIPEYKRLETHTHTLEGALMSLELISSRKITGGEAIQHLKEILMCCEPDDAYIIERIIEKDCKIGYGTRMINKVFPDLIEKTGYMGCKSYSKELIMKLLSKGTAYSQEKMDGRYLNSIIHGGEVANESRQGEPTILEYPFFITELAQLEDCVLNGELTMEGIPRYESNGMIASLISIANKKASHEDPTKEIAKFESKHMPYYEALDLIRFTAWDMLTLDEYFTRKCSRPYGVRLEALRQLFSKGYKSLFVVETRFVSTLAEVMEHFEEVVARDGEGTVVKSMDGLWVDSKPTYQIKVKKEINLDLRITGFNYGSKGTKNEFLISSVNVESEDGLLKTKPQGLDEDEMEYVTNNQLELLGKILEIKCSGLSQDSNGNYSTLHPVYKLIRTDKTIANTLAECIEISNSSSLL
jgi:ATP-dependent DNA ligase